MGNSVVTVGLRVSVRTARRALRTSRELSDLGLAALDLVDRALGSVPETDPYVPPRRDPVEVDDAVVEDLVYVDEPAEHDEPATALDDDVEPAHIDVESELVDEVADPGAEDGAGASIRVDAPLSGYDALRASDLIARLPSFDIATLAAVELYEGTHRRRRTVLDAVARELRRRS